MPITKRSGRVIRILHERRVCVRMIVLLPFLSEIGLTVYDTRR